jgi:hypothetical protein
MLIRKTLSYSIPQKALTRKAAIYPRVEFIKEAKITVSTPMVNPIERN